MSQYEPLESYSSFRRLALAQWDAPSDPVIHGQMWFDLTHADAYIDALAEAYDVRVSYAALVGKAAAMALGAMPEINGKVVGRKILLNRSVNVYYQVDVGAGKDLTGTVIEDADRIELHEISQALREKAVRIRDGGDTQYEETQKRGLLGRSPIPLLARILKLFSFLMYTLRLPPQWLGATSADPFGSCMVTSVGNFGIEIAYAPLVPWTRVPYIFLVGQAQDRVVAIDGQPEVRRMLPVSATIDHRIIDGARIGQLAQRMREYIENPAEFSTTSEPGKL